MTEIRTLEKRRQIMQAVKSKDTKPEMIVRRLLHAQARAQDVRWLRTVDWVPSFGGRIPAVEA